MSKYIQNVASLKKEEPAKRKKAAKKTATKKESKDK
ncbi:hypothetical protein UFOVP784_184 [uncultured Caudovirales phage]|uniref:Uncharacterized protein n=1 Tax=uncultured Caudovirales phage TaxID=2100421 RepID=A0A6J5MEQ1_9CAUD|nr:hypothetical protein UFOVP436_184 [uncultured Caudovirales phage]CAB4162923.1 hypothetical protein UFOVP784_184 [uncultured Caudovirales phage]